jgi:hypothetical protein
MEAFAKLEGKFSEMVQDIVLSELGKHMDLTTGATKESNSPGKTPIAGKTNG